MNFHNTKMGHEFYNQNIPQLINQLTRIADSLEKIAKENHKANSNRGSTGFETSMIKKLTDISQ